MGVGRTAWSGRGVPDVSWRWVITGAVAVVGATLCAVRVKKVLGNPFAQAEPFGQAEKELDKRDRALREEHPDTVALRHRAHHLSEIGDLVGAVEISEQLLADRVRVLGEDHPQVLTTRLNLANLRGRAGTRPVPPRRSNGWCSTWSGCTEPTSSTPSCPSAPPSAGGRKRTATARAPSDDSGAAPTLLASPEAVYARTALGVPLRVVSRARTRARKQARRPSHSRGGTRTGRRAAGRYAGHSPCIGCPAA